MKYHHLIITSALVFDFASAQVPVTPTITEERVVEMAPADVVETTVTETVPAGSLQAAEVAARQRLNAAEARQRLGIAPVVIPSDPAVVETTTTVETPGHPPRTYVRERNVVIVEGRELPYLTIPVLFVEGSAKLLDEESRLAVADTAAAIKDVLVANPTAIFNVEGHTSTEGSDEMNMNLSAERARAIYTALITDFKIPTASLAAHGYGENYANYPDGTEEQLVLDRRVLVVRVQ